MHMAFIFKKYIQSIILIKIYSTYYYDENITQGSIP